jgi:ATP-dependent DNA helicase RecG
MEACQKRGVAAPTWSINGGFVVVTFMRPIKGDNQSDTQDGTQDGTQGGTQGDTQGDTQSDTQGDALDIWIEEQIRRNPKITTEELARISKKGLATIKRHIAKLAHIKYVGSGYSGHWEIIEDDAET